MWLGIFCALSATASLFCLLAAFYAARIAAQRVAWPRQALRSCELRIASLEDSRTELVQSVTDLTNRLKMMRVRSASTHAAGSSGEPDPYKDPDAWRKLANQRLAAAKMGMNQ